MSILKLANAGDEATLDITGCEVVAGQYGEQVQFDAGDDRLYLPKSSADRQLERIYPNWDFNYDHIIGETLHFSRTPSSKPGSKPFWNINTVKAGNGKPPVAKSNEKKAVSIGSPGFLEGAEEEDAKELAAKLAGVDTSKLEKDLALYLAISEWVVKKVGPIYADGIGWSPESATAAVATIFIQAKRNQ